MKRSGVGSNSTKRVRFAEVEQVIIPETKTPEEDSARNDKKEVDWLRDVRSGEVELTGPSEEDGVEYEPFNLEEERSHGTFEEDGYYVENRKEKMEETDAWLDSDDSKICAKSVIERHERIRDALDAADKAPELTKDEMRQLKEKIVSLLLPKETVLTALKRLAKKKPPSGASKEEVKSEMKDFEDLTEAADMLLNSGNTDAYSMHREEFQHEIEATQNQALFQDVDPDEDMFADESDNAKQNPSPSATETEENEEKLREEGKGVKRMRSDIGVVEKYEEDSVSKSEFSSWSISELKQFLHVRNISFDGMIEKTELVQKAREIAKQTDSYSLCQAPEGYVYDPNSGYFYSNEHEMYYDGPSRCFYNPKTEKWCDENWKEFM